MHTVIKQSGYNLQSTIYNPYLQINLDFGIFLMYVQSQIKSNQIKSTDTNIVYENVAHLVSCRHHPSMHADLVSTLATSQPPSSLLSRPQQTLPTEMINQETQST